MHTYEETREFEAEVRRVAAAIWGLAPGECQPEHFATSGPLTELDGIARLRDVTHVIMATVSRKLEKAKEDVKKLDLAAKSEAKRGNPVRKWFITKYQLEAEHIRHARDHDVTALTLDQFRDRFFNGRDYIAKRSAAPFGSARHLGDGSASIPEDEYVPLPLRVEERTAKGTLVKELSLDDVVDALRRGEIVVVVGPFGAGKSLTARELFFRLSKHYLENADRRAPVAVNLREHWGAHLADEILERHARTIGFTPREDLVVAWRAGMAHLLIDGFDEMAAQVVAGADKLSFMRQARFDALLAVRDLILGKTAEEGALLCGRDHYFDNLQELAHSLGLVGRRFTIVRLGEFTEEQASRFLEKHGVTPGLPDWLPRKPLILGYLAHRGLLPEILGIDSTLGFGFAWDSFLSLICNREAAHGRSVMDPDTLRRVLERLAIAVRSSSSGTGPVTGRDLAEAYQAETGQVPEDGVLMQLQRLPGLTQREQDPSARSFIDEDLLAALQGSAIARVILEGWAASGLQGWLSGLSPKAVSMAAHVVREAGGDASSVVSACLLALNQAKRGSHNEQLAADLVSVALALTADGATVDFQGIHVDGASLHVVDLEEANATNLTIESSIVQHVILGGVDRVHVVFRDCLIERVSGVASADGLPTNFQKCTVECFDEMATNAAVVDSTLEPGVKALVTVLRKLYLQSGAGRKMGALRRGLPNGRVLDAVPNVVALLQSAGLVVVSGEVVNPIRRSAARVHQIVAAPSLSEDPIVEEARRL